MKREGHYCVFEEADIAYLREHYPTECACDIAEHLGVSPPVVGRKARELGLKKADGWNVRSYTNRYVKDYKHLEGVVKTSVERYNGRVRV